MWSGAPWGAPSAPLDLPATDSGRPHPGHDRAELSTNRAIVEKLVDNPVDAAPPGAEIRPAPTAPGR